jgi:hypothetical protein
VKASRNTFSRILCIFLLAVLSLPQAACMGAIAPPVPPEGSVYALQTGTTMYNIQRAMSGAPSTFIFMKDNVYIFMWGMKNQGVGFTLISNPGYPASNWQQVTGGKAMLTNYKDAQSIVEYLKANGWKAIIPAEVSAAVKAYLDQAASFLGTVRVPTITLFVLPLEIADPCSEYMSQFEGRMYNCYEQQYQ